MWQVKSNGGQRLRLGLKKNMRMLNIKAYENQDKDITNVHS